MITAADYADAFIAAQAQQRAAYVLPPWLDTVRQSALQHLRRNGFPGPRDEDWKYTRLGAIQQTLYRLTGDDDEAPSDAHIRAIVAAHALPDAMALLVFVNGHYQPQYAMPGGLAKLPAGLHISTLRQALARNPRQVSGYFGHLARNEDSAFTALNTVAAADGVLLIAAAEAQFEQPVQLLFVSSPKGAPISLHPHVMIHAQANSQLSVIEHFVASPDANYLTNRVTEAWLDQRATVRHYLLQEESLSACHIGLLAAYQHRDSHLESHSCSLGAGRSRTAIDIHQHHPQADCLVNGLFVASGRQHVDFHTNVEHHKPHGSSRAYFNGILQQRARGVFDGRIRVHPQAQQVDAHLSNHNLLLSKQAEIDTKPQLEIYADDVKCSHGTTIGQLDEELLFYLRSRGIAATDAAMLLTAGFGRQVVDRITDPAIRQQWDAKLLQQLSDKRAMEPG